MMLIDVYSKDVCAVVEHRKEDLKMLHTFLDNCRIHYDPASQPDVAKAAEFVTKTFFPALTEMMKALDGSGK